MSDVNTKWVPSLQACPFRRVTSQHKRDDATDLKRLASDQDEVTIERRSERRRRRAVGVAAADVTHLLEEEAVAVVNA